MSNEEHKKNDENPHEHGVPIEINKKPYKAPREQMTAREIKALAGYDDNFDLILLDHRQAGGTPLPDDQVVHLKPGMRFRCLERNRNVGDGVHPDHLTAADQLRSLGLSVDVRAEGGMVGYLIDAFPLPPGCFNASNARLLLRFPADPNGAPDMFWLSPEAMLPSGGTPEAADVIEHHFGQAWRRYSWHRNGAPWLPGRDSALTYLAFVEDRLARGR